MRTIGGVGDHTERAGRKAPQHRRRAIAQFPQLAGRPRHRQHMAGSVPGKADHALAAAELDRSQAIIAEAFDAGLSADPHIAVAIFKQDIAGQSG
jgi:hypothetical protein